MTRITPYQLSKCDGDGVRNRFPKRLRKAAWRAYGSYPLQPSVCNLLRASMHSLISSSFTSVMERNLSGSHTPKISPSMTPPLLNVAIFPGVSRGQITDVLSLPLHSLLQLQDSSSNNQSCRESLPRIRRISSRPFLPMYSRWSF
jgi:hypothetical protein